MVIIPKYLGQTGNQLFQYAFARVLAMKLGLSFSTPSISLFPNAIYQQSLGVTLHGPVVHIDDNGGHGSDLTLNEIEQRCLGARVEVCGFFERADYYTEYRELIKDWLPISTFKEDRVAIHVRGRDHKKASLGIEYYTKALRLVSYKNVMVYTDDPEMSLVKELEFPVCKDGAASSFFSMATSRCIITSLSTFSWWAAFLSSATTIIQPIPVSGWRNPKSYPGKFLGVSGWTGILTE